MNPLKKHGIGNKGMADVKLEDFKEMYEWQIKEGYGHERKKTIVGMPLSDYYDLGLFCIKNKISISGFLKIAYKERKHLCEVGLLQVHEDNTDLLKNSIKKQNKKIEKRDNVRSLF